MVKAYEMPMEQEQDVIISDANGKEFGYLQTELLDFEVGEANDFEFLIDYEEWDVKKYEFGNRIFVPGTEFGGLIDGRTSDTARKNVRLHGTTWRGLLSKKVVLPPLSETHKIISGDLNKVLKNLIDHEFDGLFVTADALAGISVANYPIDRFDNLLHAVEKMLKSNNCKLSLKYVQTETGGHVEVEAVPILDYSDILEFSQEDAKISMVTEDFRDSINHLVCLGSGEGLARQILHLYIQQDGSIGKTQFYKGKNERAEVYDYNNVNSIEELESAGRKKLAEMQKTKQCKVDVSNLMLTIGDIVAGYDFITDTYVRAAINSIECKFEDGNMEIKHKVGD